MHKDLPTDFKNIRKGSLAQLMRNATDGLHIIRDLIALRSITTGNRTDQFPVFISNGYR